MKKILFAIIALVVAMFASVALWWWDGIFILQGVLAGSAIALATIYEDKRAEKKK